MLLLLALAAIWALAYFRARLPVWTAVLAVLLALWSVLGHSGTMLQIVVWLLFAIVSTLVNVTSLRRQLISRRVYLIFRRLLPPLSRTEREALKRAQSGGTANFSAATPIGISSLACQ